MNKKIIFTRSNACSPDPRIDKEASSLAKQGYDVEVLAWDREGKHKKEELFNGYRIHRFKFKSPYGTFKLFFYLVIWNIYEFFFLLFHKWDIVHACCLDNVIPSYIVAKIKGEKIVYDIFDFYSDSLPLHTPLIVRNIISKIERYFIKKADWVIIVDESRFKQIGIKKNRISVIMNTPKDENLKNKVSKAKEFLVFFAGIISTTRSIIEMAEVIEGIPHSQLILAGFGENTLKVIKKLKRFKLTKFIGPIPYNKVIELSYKAHILFAIYDPRIPNHRFSSANKLFEAMMCAKPIIVAKGTSMDKIVKKEKCGLIINYGNKKQLKKALLRLKNNPNLTRTLGNNGRSAYERLYNWDIMEKNLLNIYKALF